MKQRLLFSVMFVLLSGLMAVAPSSSAQARSAEANSYFFSVNYDSSGCADNGGIVFGAFSYNLPDNSFLTIRDRYNGGAPFLYSTAFLSGSAVTPENLVIVSPPFVNTTTDPYTWQWIFTVTKDDFTTTSIVSISCMPPYNNTNGKVTVINGIGTEKGPTGVDGAGIVLPMFTDGRCNQDADQSVTVYPDGKGGYDILAVNQGKGDYAFHVSKATLDANPDKGHNYLIAEGLGAQMYRLAGGALQVNRPLPDGKMYIFDWTFCA